MDMDSGAPRCVERTLTGPLWQPAHPSANELVLEDGEVSVRWSSDAEVPGLDLSALAEKVREQMHH